jgi:hypothetical protein
VGIICPPSLPQDNLWLALALIPHSLDSVRKGAMLFEIPFAPYIFYDILSLLPLGSVPTKFAGARETHMIVG